jgi:hypothetical protein
MTPRKIILLIDLITTIGFVVVMLRCYGEVRRLNRMKVGLGGWNRLNYTWFSPSLLRIYAISFALFWIGTISEKRWFLLGRCAATVGTLLFILAFLMSMVHRRQTAKHLRANSFRVCAQCQYDLQGSPSCGHCPECGLEYTPDSLRADWSSAL